MHISDFFKNKELFDSHAHINSLSYQYGLDRMLGQTELQVLDVGTDVESSKRSLKISSEFKSVNSFIGIDPEVFIPTSEDFIGLDKDSNWIEEQYNILKELIVKSHKKVAGIGETGMDYYWLKDVDILDIEKSKRLQEKLFE